MRRLLEEDKFFACGYVILTWVNKNEKGFLKMKAKNTFNIL